MEMDAKTLRALAKAAGLKPMVFFRLTPEQVLEAVKEHDPETYKDLETWTNETAVAHMGSLAVDKGKELVEELESSTKEPEAAKTKEKKAEEPVVTQTKEKTTRKRAPKKEPKGATETSDTEDAGGNQRVGPTKKRPKRSKAHGPVTASMAMSADMEEVKAQLGILEDQVTAARTMINELVAVNREMMLFFTWWHNKYLNEDPEPEILGIDWESCIKDQIN